MIYVCSLSKLPDTAQRVQARHIITLINADMAVPTPTGVAPENHLILGFNDIVNPVDGLLPPGEAHVAQLVEFIADWPRDEPLIIHCWAGISRSTAGAYIAACVLNPDTDEALIAQTLRQQAPSATPNGRLVAIADKLLGRNGRMIDAVRRIGRGEDAFEGTPFQMPLSYAGNEEASAS
ncbi:tyrosine phosphatase family protein [Roseibium sp. CAU 1637]|uniref:Tyrosine phosphatase family protein n=1 Tax=Roseibium limicola TaxID=2816037 RepID=A0A939J6V8_9HYPH|nr:tyrosine phosphatase family protein [Roseibium limicola]MBO0345517.1 tyrosine phosphatase family protein [Roseibium limicola]